MKFLDEASQSVFETLCDAQIKRKFFKYILKIKNKKFIFNDIDKLNNFLKNYYNLQNV